MTRTIDRAVERQTNVWLLLAAAILGIQGISKVFYATFLPAPISNAGIEVPLLGTAPFVWIAAGVIALIAGAGVATRKTWGRYLGTVAAVIAIAAGLYNSQNVVTSLLAFVLPGVVLFVLWRKWPTTES